MNEELAYRILAYLIAHYKTHDETITNKEEINAINFIIEENEQLKENYECIKRQRDDISKNATEQLENSINEIKQLKEQLQQKEDIIDKAKEKLDKANKKIEKMFDDGDENKVIDDLIEIQKILDIDKGE